VERVDDPTLAKGKRVVDEEGSAPTRTSATREVYSADGELIHSETWTTSYDGEDRVVRIGTKVTTKKAKPAETTPGPDAAPDSTAPPTRP
jgi:uncharacterized protein YabE (DUF348 family)